MAGWILSIRPCAFGPHLPIIGACAADRVFTSGGTRARWGALQRGERALRHDQRLGTPYLRAIEAGGGIPVVLAPQGPERPGR